MMRASLWRVSLLGGVPGRIIDDVHSAVGWSPDGRQLLVDRNIGRTQNWDIWRADADLSDPTQLTHADGDDLIGWGSGQYFSEYSRRGKLILAGRFVGTNYTYRIYRFPWVGTPGQPPGIAATTSGDHAVVCGHVHGVERRNHRGQ